MERKDRGSKAWLWLLTLMLVPSALFQNGMLGRVMEAIAISLGTISFLLIMWLIITAWAMR
jgi:uncharacterized membrane protein